MNYEKAFQCHDCPETNTSKGCPLWWELLYTNPASGEEKFIKACAGVQMQMVAIELIKAANRPAAAVESMRNEMVEGLSKLAAAPIGKLIAEYNKAQTLELDHVPAAKPS